MHQAAMMTAGKTIAVTSTAAKVASIGGSEDGELVDEFGSARVSEVSGLSGPVKAAASSVESPRSGPF